MRLGAAEMGLRRITAIARLFQCLIHLAAGYWIIRIQFPKLNSAARAAAVRRWAQGMLQRMNITLSVRGQLAQGPVLLAANHISWLDILALHAAGYCRFVSKADIQNWPIVGTLATGAGTIYIERDKRRDALRVMHHIAKALGEESVVAIFPEGTTGDGQTMLPFHANLLQAAIATHSPVQPVGLGFMDMATGQRSNAPRFYGDDTLVQSLWRTLTSAAITTHVHFGELQEVQNRDRRAWAQDLRLQIERLRQKP